MKNKKLMDINRNFINKFRWKHTFVTAFYYKEYKSNMFSKETLGKVMENKNFIIDQNDITNFSLPKKKEKKKGNKKEISSLTLLQCIDAIHISGQMNDI